MSTFSSTAATLAYVTTTGSTSWNSKGAFQGQYKGWSSSRVGAMIFPTLRDIAWQEQNISEIRMVLKFAAAGGNESKTLSLYRGTSNTLSGSGTNMRGTKIGDFTSNGNAYNGTRTIYFNSNTNSDTFTNLTSYLQGGSTINTLVLYRAETISGSESYTRNYLEVTAATIYVDYETKGSTGTVNSPVALGQNITCTITPISVSGQTVMHTVEWILGNHTSGVRDVTATSGTIADTYTLPTNWADAIPQNATSRAGQCIITTIVGGTVSGTQIVGGTTYGSRTVEFVATLSDMVPTISCTLSRNGTYGGKSYQYFTSITFTVTATAKNGASIVGCSIKSTSTTENYSYNTTSSSFSANVGPFQNAGYHQYIITAVDSRGLKSTYTTASTSVKAVSRPSINSFVLSRCSQSSEYPNPWGDDPLGRKVWFSLDASISNPDSTDNSYPNYFLEAYIRYKSDSSSTWSSQYTIYSKPSSSSTRTINKTKEEGRQLLASITFNANTAYSFEVHVKDRANNEVVVTSRIEKSTAPVHIAGNGYGVGFGMYSTGKETDPAVQSAWRLWVQEDISSAKNIIAGGDVYSGGDLYYISSGTTQYKSVFETQPYTKINHTITLNTNYKFQAYAGGALPTITRKGFMIELSGILQPKETLPPTDTNGIVVYNMLDLVYYDDTAGQYIYDYCPNKQVFAIMQGSGSATWLLRVRARSDASTPGRVTIERYRTGDTYQDMVAGSTPTWLPFYVTWMAAD